MEHFLEVYYALFPSRQGKLCYHTCYRSTRFWNVIGAKSGECSKCSWGKGGRRSRRIPFVPPSRADRQRNEFIGNGTLGTFFLSNDSFHRVQNVIGYINQRWIDIRSLYVCDSGRGSHGYFERLRSNRWFPISFESRVARFHGSLLVVSHDGN